MEVVIHDLEIGDGTVEVDAIAGVLGGTIEFNSDDPYIYQTIIHHDTDLNHQLEHKPQLPYLRKSGRLARSDCEAWRIVLDFRILADHDGQVRGFNEIPAASGSNSWRDDQDCSRRSIMNEILDIGRRCTAGNEAALAFNWKEFSAGYITTPG